MLSTSRRNYGANRGVYIVVRVPYLPFSCQFSLRDHQKKVNINRDTANMSRSSDSSPKKKYQESKSTSLEGYMHGLSKIKTASNGAANYFDLKLQI
ncbi:uncharacterized protein LOC141859602 isoform X2 [Acropora palmata]|uniref:uncharacterized protein LOC141859602 isoform X2 n=1 Tax=Acropora palmata TaxID=6131 RepID=UPI003DA15FD7